MSLRDLNQISIERDISETPQKHLKRNVFCDVFKTSQIHLKKRCIFRDVFKTSQKHPKKNVFKTSRTYLKKDVFSVTSVRRLKNISCKHFWFPKNTSQKYVTMPDNLCDFRRLIIMFDKIDVGLSETLKK